MSVRGWMEPLRSKEDACVTVRHSKDKKRGAFLWESWMPFSRLGESFPATASEIFFHQDC